MQWGQLTKKYIDPVILRKKAQKKRKETGDERWKAPIEKSIKSMVRTVGYSLLRPFQILAYEPMALILNLYSAILLGILYLFFGAFPLVFEGVYGFNLWQTGLTFLGMLLGMLSAALSSGFWVKVRARLIERNGGKLEPEFRLPAVIVGSMFVTVGLFWFAWTTFSWVHWILPIIGSGIFGLGVSFLSLHVNTVRDGLHDEQTQHRPVRRGRRSVSQIWSVIRIGSIGYLHGIGSKPPIDGQCFLPPGEIQGSCRRYCHCLSLVVAWTLSASVAQWKGHRLSSQHTPTL